MMIRVNVGPYTNFDEIYTYLKCPARLYLRLIGCESEIERKHVPPGISPALLGRNGERLLEQSYIRKPDVYIPKVPVKEFIPPRDTLEKALTKVRSTIANNITVLFSQIREIEVKYLPTILSDEAKRIKEDHKVKAIIGGVSFTTVPHHRIGRIDFLGLKENREVVVIEVKNKQAKPNERDRLQLEYYIDGLSKQYQYMKLGSHLHEIASQLYPEKYRIYVKLARIVDLLWEGIADSQDIVEVTIRSLNDEDRKKFSSIYPSSTEFLATIPEYVMLERLLNHYSNKMSLSKKEFEQASYRIVELIESGVKSGLLVDLRRNKEIEVSKTIDFDELVKGVWRIKKSAFDGKKTAIKITKECGLCVFKNACRSILRDGEPDECKSITSLVHRRFKDLEIKTGQRIGKFLGLKYNPNKLLKQALSRTEWKYVPMFAKKRGWIELYNDAVASKKLEKEFSFWGI
ncbi:MAG: PD-(D/E)XK nuclease family protein [Nitrososphaerota archaeon]